MSQRREMAAWLCAAFALIMVAGCQIIPSSAPVSPTSAPIRPAATASIIPTSSTESAVPAGAADSVTPLATATTALATPAPSVAPSPSPTVQAAPTLVPLPPATPVVTPVIPSPAPRDLLDLERRLGAKPAATQVATPAVAPNYPVGSQQTFWVADQQQKNYFQMHTQLLYKTDHTYWYVQDGVNIPVANLQAAGTYFEQHTYPTEHQLFGSEWTPGIDNDRHITLLVGHVPGVGGYYSTADEYPRSVNPYSNLREMIYLNVDAVQPGNLEFNATVAHEFMHMIQFHVHRWQDSWIDEGSAELAAQAVTGVASSGVPSFERDPSIQLNAWASDPSLAIPHYGEAYLFMRYVAEHYGGFQSIGKVIAEPARSIDSFQTFFASLKPPTGFNAVFADWVAANALDDSSLDNGKYGYRNLSLSIQMAPGPTVGSTVSGSVTEYGADYYRIQTTAPATLVFTGTTSVALTGANPHAGSFEWWSNRGDSIDTTLTRVVDLTKVKAATLKFWVWYDIERDFDYAYVEVSTDGGTTWHTLPAPNTTASNPNGQNYGNGFTGTSGSTTASWLPESVDLSAYAGRQIQLRFEYVTDDAYNADGLDLSGVEIPQIGFHDDPGTDDGWVAKGFVRITNRLPQDYLVEVLNPKGKPFVEHMAIGSDDRGRLSLSAGENVIVAVAGLTPLTTHHVPFQISLLPSTESQP
ncbi:MAG TPA: hypothetical protein VNG11_05055 [Chloroflexota bacterium]|nr:hypothetical protein [Chloroflexota bacterium]